MPFGDIAVNPGETAVKLLMHELYSLDISLSYVTEE